MLVKIGCLKFGNFTLKSGMKSPVYIDLRILVSFPRQLQVIGQAYAQVLQNLEYDRLAAVPYAALPLCCAASLATGKPWIYTRKEAKTDHGIAKPVEGLFKKGEKIVLIDDLVTNGLSKLEVIKPLEHIGLIVKDIVVLIDREQGGEAELKEKGYQLHSVLKFTQMLEILKSEQKIDDDKYQQTIEFLHKTGK